MSPAKEQFDSLDFLHAWLKGQECKDAHHDLRDYHERVAAAFCRVFQVDMTDMAPDPQSHAEDCMVELFRSVVEARSKCRSPFSFYLQAPRELGDLYRRHGKSIDQTNASLRQQYDELLLELLEMTKGIKDTHTIPRELLVQCGFPEGPAPAEIDYF